MKLADSTKRSLRTFLHGALAFVIAIPTLEPIFDSSAKSLPGGDKLIAYGASLVALSAVVSKIINTLEDAGVIPSWLKVTPPPVPVTVPPVSLVQPIDPKAP